MGPPDLVVEILSPSTAERDRGYKRALYAQHGVKEYWVVGTDAGVITVLLLGDDGYEVVDTFSEGDTLISPTLAGFSLQGGRDVRVVVTAHSHINNLPMKITDIQAIYP